MIDRRAMKYQDINAETIDRWVKEGWEWGRPIDHETYLKARDGEWQVFLTPTKAVPHEWFGEIAGKDLLGLASGGGQQMPIFAAAGAKCTVLDISVSQTDTEKQVAEREGYDINIVRADMTEKLPFEDGSFDIVFNPVSNCYVRFVEPIWRECYRILKPGGRLLAAFDNSINFIVDDLGEKIINHLPFDPLADGKQMEQLKAGDEGVQFSHSLTENIGGQLKAGFTLAGLYEDTNNSGRLYELNIPCYVATLAVKNAQHQIS